MGLLLVTSSFEDESLVLQYLSLQAERHRLRAWHTLRAWPKASAHLRQEGRILDRHACQDEHGPVGGMRFRAEEIITRLQGQMHGHASRNEEVWKRRYVAHKNEAI